MEPPVLVNTEFEIDAFAKFYEALSDSFIDIDRASRSLAAMLDASACVFEIGLGTGYFAEQLSARGFNVCGIQPPDSLLSRFKTSGRAAKLVAEKTLEQYDFDRQYDAIVSHSSVFLFTKHISTFGPNGERVTELVFQSFVKTRFDVHYNLLKTIDALKSGGRLFINIQGNPLRSVRVGPAEDELLFEMPDCSYDFGMEKVSKIFRATYKGTSYLVRDDRYCCRGERLIQWLRDLGVECSVSDGYDWVVIAKIK